MAKKNAIIIPIILQASTNGTAGATGGENAPKSSENQQKNPEQKKDPKKAETLAKSAGNAAKAIVAKVAGQTASLALSGYGDLTGNYVQGANIQTAVKETASIAAAVSLGPVGIALYAVDKGVQAFRYESEMRKSEMRSNFARQRVYGTTKKS